MEKQMIRRFQNRKSALAFAKPRGLKVEPCKKYNDGAFPYQVVIVKEEKDG